MPTISQRGIDMPASPIRKLVPLANKAKAKGIKVYHLNIGQPDLETPEVALRAVHHLERKVLEYSPSEGILSFREKLVGYYQKFNIDVCTDDIIITTGGSEAVFFSFMACLDPGDEIIVPEPAYANYMAFAISCGAIIKTIASTIEEGFALPSVEKFEALITPRTKAILICNPNNPTGYLYTRKEMNQIRDLVKKYDLFLFSDEVYREFCYTGAPYISAFHLEGIENNVILVDSVSKRYSECGIRIGALITKNKQVRENVMKWCQARLSPPLIGQIMAEASLDTPEEYMREVYDEYVERRKFLIDGINRIPGCYSPIPMGAFYTVAKLPVDDADKFCAWCLEDFEYEGQQFLWLLPPDSTRLRVWGKMNPFSLCPEKRRLGKALIVLEKSLGILSKKIKSKIIEASIYKQYKFINENHRSDTRQYFQKLVDYGCSPDLGFFYSDGLQHDRHVMAGTSGK
ncbi:MAG: pyridoxal phosphate-dependent aminotransferase [Odoribacter sp.]